MEKTNYDLKMNNISKEFPGVKALDKVNFYTNRGTVSAIVGANGAGKSTLMKVLTGVYDDYDGEITIDNNLYKMTTPIVSKKAGIMCVYQEVDVSLVPYLSVAENIFIDQLAISKNKFFIDWKKINKDASDILNEMKVDIDPKKIVNELSLADKQLVLIARAMSLDIKYLILDEPTAPLSVKEINKLFEIINNLKKKDVGIIYISHRLNEVLEITDNITVMRNGQVTANLDTKKTTREEIIKNMVGNYLNEFPKANVEIGDEIFRCSQLNFSNKVRDVSFSLREGEILGIAGLVGAGKTELSKIIFGAEKNYSGKIFVRGNETKIVTPSDAVKNGIALIPEERRKEGVLVDEDITRNLSISSLNKFCKYSFINNKLELESSKQTVNELAVKTPSVSQLVKNLSGGNQQKIVVGKWLVSDSDIFLMDEPTKGVDVGSKTEIFKLVSKLVKEKKGVIYFSNELEEIIGIADRILVMYDGKIVKEIKRENANLEKILYYCTGGTDDVQ